MAAQTAVVLVVAQVVVAVVVAVEEEVVVEMVEDCQFQLFHLFHCDSHYRRRLRRRHCHHLYSLVYGPDHYLVH